MIFNNAIATQINHRKISGVDKNNFFSKKINFVMIKKGELFNG